MFLFVFVVIVHSFVSLIAAQDGVDLGALPQCALPCLMSSIEASSCTNADLPCICDDTKLIANVTQCVPGECSTRQTSLSVMNTFCKIPVRDQGPAINSTAASLGGVALLLVALRFVSRRYFTIGGFGLDDYALVIPTLVLFIITAAQFLMTKNGLGKDVWAVEPDNIDKILMWYYAAEIMYVVITGMTKVSLLLLYLRLFPSRSMKIKTSVMLGCSTIYILVFVFLVIFQCSPLAHAWRFWDHERPGKCINVNAMVWGMAAYNIAMDLAILALPVRELLKLSLPCKQRIYVLLIFSLGIFVTVVSIIRLKSLVEFAKSLNFTYDHAVTAYWSMVELNVGLICVSLPAIRPFFKLLSPRLFGSKDLTSMNAVKERSIRLQTERVRAERANADNESDVVSLVNITQSWPSNVALPENGHGGDRTASTDNKV